MTNSTIQILQQIKSGSGFTLTKDTDDEIFDIIKKLSGLEIVEKRGNSYFVNHQKISLLNRLIKLKNYDKFIEWLDNPIEEKQNFNNIFKIIGGTMAILIPLVALLFGDDLYSKFYKKNEKEAPKTVKTSTTKASKLKIKNEYIPYVGNKEIIDKGLFISQNYANLVIGGANIEDIEISAVSDRSEKIEINIDENKNLSMDIFARPYIEIKYKNKFYKIEVYTVDKAASFDFDLTEVENSTFTLRKYNDL